MGFMQAEVTEKQFWWEVDGPNGLYILPADYFTRKQAKEQYPGKAESSRKIKRYGVRMSAPGYMDCTEWELYTNKREAIKRAKEMEIEE